MVEKPSSTLAIILYFVIGTLMFFGVLDLAGIINPTTCNIRAKFDDDLYCVLVPTSNFSYANDKEWREGSHEQDRLNKIAYDKRIAEKQEKQRIAKECYDAGYLVNESFTIRDYGLNCKKIDYLNDHLQDNFERRDGGYVSSSYSGFFSRRSTKTQLYEYVNDRVLATGKLIENINYHLDCEEVKHREQINYFAEEEFVMFYVDNCIK